jgi:hypothetical protein
MRAEGPPREPGARARRRPPSGPPQCHTEPVIPRARPPLALALLLLVTACARGPSKNDLYMEGLQIEGDAERGPCKLHYVEGQPAALLSGDELTNCRARTEDALAKYDEAARLGLDDPDFAKVHQRAKDRVQRLDEMITQVRKMERGQE